MPKSKALAAWIALVGGSLGLHRFYLHGFADPWGWLFPVPTLLGLLGVQRLRDFGTDDRLAWALLPLLGLMVSATMLVAIVHALTPDERWNARHNPQGPPSRTGWAAVLAAVLGLLLGAGVLMATVAYTGEHVFRMLLEPRWSQSSGIGNVACRWSRGSCIAARRSTSTSRSASRSPGLKRSVPTTSTGDALQVRNSSAYPAARRSR